MTHHLAAPHIHATTILIPGDFTNAEVPARTPWGPVQQSERIMWGGPDHSSRVPLLWQVHTAGHGGTRIHPQLARSFLNGMPSQCHAYGGSRLWYEEDCESAVPLFIFYNGLSEDCWLVNPDKPFPRAQLMDSIRHWMPDACYAVRRLAANFDAALANANIPLRQPLND